jgi:hypothetical protein
MAGEFALLSIAIVVGAFIGGSIAWFARGMIADVQREDELADHRVQAQHISDKWK